jgi:hypothetical protein
LGSACPMVQNAPNSFSASSTAAAITAHLMAM